MYNFQYPQKRVFLPTLVALEPNMYDLGDSSATARLHLSPLLSKSSKHTTTTLVVDVRHAAAEPQQEHLSHTYTRPLQYGREYTTTAPGRTAASTWALSQCRVLVRHHYPHGTVPQ